MTICFVKDVLLKKSCVLSMRFKLYHYSLPISLDFLGEQMVDLEIRSRAEK